jgi:hypothetical protein
MTTVEGNGASFDAALKDATDEAMKHRQGEVVAWQLVETTGETGGFTGGTNVKVKLRITAGPSTDEQK